MNFLRYCTYTRDEVNPFEPIRLAPVWENEKGFKPYIEPLVRLWEGESKFVIDKARRMWISYLMLALHLHYAFTNTDRRIGIMSKKFDDACAHLENMKAIYEAIPEDIYPKDCRPTLHIREGRITFTEINTYVHALASGPDQARQYGFSKIFWDEMDFCEDQELTYGALAPTLQNGGTLSIATTHRMVDSGEDSFYKKLTSDEIGGEAIRSATTPKVGKYARFALEGLSIRKNPKNGFLIAELDFIADPMKRSPEWIENERRSMPPKQWAVEMLRSWETFAGRPVFAGAFFRHLHVPTTAPKPNPNYPIFRGWDFGGNQSVAIAQIVGNRLIVIDEIPNGGINTKQFAPAVIAFCNNQFGDGFHYIDIVDPSAAWEGKTAEGKACTDVMREFGLTPIAASTNDPEKRINAIFDLLMRNGEEGKPCFELSPVCSMLIRGFEGLYHFPEKETQAIRLDRPVKNLASHVMDGLQYIALRMKSMNANRLDEGLAYERSLTSVPRYSWSR